MWPMSKMHDKANPDAMPAPSRFILASSSPRRKELLAAAGYTFDVVGPTIHEPDWSLRGLGPVAQAEALAYFKARCIWDADPDAWVLGADTIVALGDEIMGKPAGRDDARRMLRALCGTRQAVITGVAILGPDGRRLIESDVTYVAMRAADDRQIEEYLDSGEWEGKAGAYAIQETGDRFVEAVEGSFTNVVGLPMELVERMLDRMGYGKGI